MLKEFRAKNIVRFNELKISADDKVTLLYGQNGSGKTLLIKTLSHFKNFLISALYELESIYAELAFDKSEPIYLGLSFVSNDNLYEYVLGFDKTRVIFESLHYNANNNRPRFLFERKYKEGEYLWKFGDKFKSSHLVKKVGSNRPVVLIGYIAKQEHISNLFLWVNDLTIDDKSMTLTEIKQNICSDKSLREFLGKSFEFADIDITGFLFSKNDDNIVSAIMRDGRHLSLSRLSTGEFNFIKQMILLYYSKKVIMIDDLGLGYHQSLTPVLLDIMTSLLNKQIIATTHDVSLMNDWGEQVWLIDKDKLSKQSFLINLSEIEEESSNLAEDYLNGQYGAIPKFKREVFEQ